MGNAETRMQEESQHVECQGSSPLEEELQSNASGLGSLLEEESFLLMLFEHLVEYGLHDCRLVCKKWHAVCKLFPLKFEDIDFRHLGEVADSFPNTVGLSIYKHDSVNGDSHFFTPLIAFRNLKSLTFRVRSLSSADRTRDYFQPLTQLVDLEFFVCSSVDTEDLVSSLRHLTNLSKLQVTGRHQQLRITEPFVELQNIQHLHVQFGLLTDEQGVCFFPSLTNLTCLEVEYDSIDDVDHSLTTQAFSLYGSTLQHLSLRIYSRADNHGFGPLSSLTNLTILEASEYCACRESFWRSFQSVTSLKKVRMPYGCYRHAVVRHPALIPKGVEALESQGNEVQQLCEVEASPPAEIARLRELEITLVGVAVAQLSSLTLLEHLRLTVYSNCARSLDDVLPCMPYMQTLEVMLSIPHGRGWRQHNYGRLSLSGSSLEGMSRLRALSLECVDVDDSFFYQLASVERLTKLKFVAAKHAGYSDSFFSQGNHLTHLLELRLGLQHGCNVCGLLFPGSLSHLKRLQVSGTEEQLASLRKKFANTGVLINHQRSPWCSRLSSRN